MANEIMTVEQLAKYLNVGVTPIYKLANDGKIPGTKVGNQWRFRKEKIDEWLDKGGKVKTKK
jgi:excisionase family DNA binding protein